MKLKGVIRLVSPETVQTQWCVLQESREPFLAWAGACQGQCRAMPGAILGQEEPDVLPSLPLPKAVQVRATLLSFLAAAFIRVLSARQDYSHPLDFGVN